MKNTYKQKVLAICDKILSGDYLTIIDKLVDCTLKDNIEHCETLTGDDIGYFIFEADIIMECIDRSFISDIHVLTELILALQEWEEDFEFINNSLGLPPEA